MNRLARTTLAVAALVGPAACGAADDGSARITVSAATSLSGAFTELGQAFTAANPHVAVDLSFGASSTLAAQILDGAPADVLASADRSTMERVAAAGLLAGEPVVFARNELVIVTKPGNPTGIAGVADLPGSGVVALCGREAPCGRYAAEVLAAAGVTVDESSVTRGQNVGATLTAVAQGDAAAGIVYVTDAARAGASVDAVPIPAEQNVSATYLVGVLGTAQDRPPAQAFAAFVAGAEGQAILAEHGFATGP